MTIVVLALALRAAPVIAQESPFPVPPGIESAVKFWNKIFLRYSFNEVVLFDPLDPDTVYGSVSAPDNEAGRALVDKERARIVGEYDLIDGETRIRSQRGAKEHFAEGLKISGRYIGEMKKIFRAEGLPAELAYLPLVESSFNVRARSSAGAVGMWQFMPDTGKKFMRIDTKVDERRDPFASTRAAARLLKENYRLLGNWPLAITAYNHGTEGIFRGVKTVESDNLVDLIRNYQSPTFGFASKNFYAEFLAVVEIALNRDTFLPYLRAHRPVRLQEVSLKRQVSIPGVLKPAAISQEDFFEWNPALEPKAKFIPVGYRVKLPPEKVEDFLSAQRRLNASTAAAVKKKTNATVKIRNGKSGNPARSAKGKAAVRLSDGGVRARQTNQTASPAPVKAHAPVKFARQ